jgi:hypothetical protein
MANPCSFDHGVIKYWMMDLAIQPLVPTSKAMVNTM